MNCVEIYCISKWNSDFNIGVSTSAVVIPEKDILQHRHRYIENVNEIEIDLDSFVLGLVYPSQITQAIVLTPAYEALNLVKNYFSTLKSFGYSSEKKYKRKLIDILELAKGYQSFSFNYDEFVKNKNQGFLENQTYYTPLKIKMKEYAEHLMGLAQKKIIEQGSFDINGLLCPYHKDRLSTFLKIKTISPYHPVQFRRYATSFYRGKRNFVSHLFRSI